MKKIAIFLLSSMCVFNIAYAMQEKNKGKRRPHSIELGSYFLYRNCLKPRSVRVITQMDIIDSKMNPLYYFSEEWLEYMGKMADKILPLTDEIDTLLNIGSEQFDAEFIARHEQLITQIGPKDDEDEFWLIKS
jgi:hypothetical protein